MNEDKQTIETIDSLLTALDTALELAQWSLGLNAVATNEAINSAQDEIRQLQEYAASERARFRE